MVVNVSSMKTDVYDDTSSKEDKIKLKLRNRKNIADDSYEEDGEWDEEDCFVADLFTFKK